MRFTLPTTAFVLLFVLLSLQSCVSGDFSEGPVGMGMDSDTKSNYNYSGVNVDKVYLTLNDQPQEDYKVPLNSQLGFHFDGIDEWNHANGLVELDIDMTVKDKDGTSVLVLNDMFDEAYPGGLDSSLARFLEPYLEIRNPMAVGEQYDVDLRIKDRKGPGTISFSMKLEVTESNLPPSTPGVNMINHNVSVGTVHLMKDGEIMDNTAISLGEQIKIVMRDVDGFTAVNDTYEIEFFIRVSDRDSNPIDSVSLDINGTDASLLSGHISLNAPQFPPQTSYWWDCEFRDKNSDAKITARTMLYVE